jgi:hypothetical protein
MEYSEAFFHNIAADLFYAAVHIGGINLCKTLEHAFFFAISLNFIKFRASVRQPSLNFYAILCVYEFAKFDNFYEGIAFILDKAYECGLYGTIRHYKKIVGAVNNDKRHEKSAVQIVTEQVAEFIDIRVFDIFLRDLILFRRKARMTARKIIFVSNMYAINDF